MVAVFVLASLLMVSVASAGGWKKCTINRVGVNSSGYIVYLGDNAAAPAFTNRQFELDPAHGKELLAIALTTQANGKIFHVFFTSTVAGSIISEAYMMD